MVNQEQFIAHVISCYPHEACGVVVNDTFIPCENVAENPEDSFAIAPEVQSKYGDTIQMIVHSHVITPAMTVDPRTPSKEDMQGQIDTDVEWGIVATDGKSVLPLITFGNPDNRPPLLEREFIFNAQDCFSLCVDWMYENKGVVLPSVPRDWFWQAKGENPFIDLYPSFGFEEVSLDEIEPGDWVYFNRTRPRVEGVCNHAAIYLGNDQILHHEYGRLSGIDELYRHHKYITKVIRYRGAA